MSAAESAASGESGEPGEPGAIVVRRAVEADRPVLASLAARLQARPDRHVAYLGLDPASIAEEMVAEDDDWTAVSAVAERGGQVVGWLMGSVDDELGRVWWFGPFADADAADVVADADAADADEGWTELASRLDEVARTLLPTSITEEEWAPDERFDLLVAWAQGRGARRDTGSVVLTLDGPPIAPFGGPPVTPAVAVRPIAAGDAETVAALHDELFPGTHTTGAGLVASAADDRPRLVAEHDGAVVGYLAAERQPDGGGYIDYVGVAPALRGRGFGAELVRAGVAALRTVGCERCHLTVRDDNAAARTLYSRLGFVEERVIVPLRIGFSLG